MPRRFALLLVGLLGLLLAALLVARRLKDSRSAPPARTPAPAPTPVIPPTPIPPRRIAVFFESPEDGLLHAEERDVVASADRVAFLRSVASEVLAGPKREDLLRPFPEGWSLRAGFLMKDGVVVLDLAPPVPGTPAEGEPAPPPARWESGTRDELFAVQALVHSVTRNVPGTARVVLVVNGEPSETLAGHLDLSHPLRPDPSLASPDPPLPPPTPGPAPEATPTPEAAPAAEAEAAAPAPPATKTPARTPSPSPSASPSPAPPTPTPTSASTKAATTA